MPQRELQHLPAEEKYQDVSFPEVNPPEVGPHCCNVVPQAPESVIDSPSPHDRSVRAARFHYSHCRKPTPRFYQDNLMLELSSKLATAQNMMNKATKKRDHNFDVLQNKLMTRPETRVTRRLV